MATPVPRACWRCGKPARYGRCGPTPARPSCSEACRVAFYRVGRSGGRRRVTRYRDDNKRRRQCVSCQVEFLAVDGFHPESRYCSILCRRRGAKVECVHCRAVVFKVSPRPNTSCDDCQRKLRRSRWEKENRAKRSRNSGTRAEKIDRLEVFKRNGWMCHLCWTTVDPSLRAPHPRSATLDHILPRSLGGLHTVENVQLAHYGCNSRKRNRIDGTQLLTVGS